MGPNMVTMGNDFEMLFRLSLNGIFSFPKILLGLIKSLEENVSIMVVISIILCWNKTKKHLDVIAATFAVYNATILDDKLMSRLKDKYDTSIRASDFVAFLKLIKAKSHLKAGTHLNTLLRQLLRHQGDGPFNS
jgi:hypothetical protein